MNGLFDFFSSDSPKNVGNDLLASYFDEAVNYPEFKFSDFESWLTWLTARVPDYETVIGDLVLSNSASTTVGQARDRMITLASQSKGQATMPQIVNASGGSGDHVNLWAAIPEVAGQTASDAADYASEVAQDVGTGVMSTLKLTKYLPWILGGAAVIYIAVNAGALKSLIGRDD